MKKPSLKDYANYFVMGLKLNLCPKSEIVIWADKLIEKIDVITDWAIELSTSANKSKLDVIRTLNSIPGSSDLEVSFRLLIAKLSLVKPVIFPDNSFMNSQDSWLFSNMYLIVAEYDDLPDCIRGNIFEIYMDMDYFETGNLDWSVIQQDYENLLIKGKEYRHLVSMEEIV